MKNLLLLTVIAFTMVGCDRSMPKPASVPSSALEPVAVESTDSAEPGMPVPATPPEQAAIDSGQTTEDPASPASDDSFRILAWNIESEGANIDVIAEEVVALGHYDLFGFTEVRPQEWGAIKDALGDGYDFWYSKTGYNDRTAYAVSKERFEIIKKTEMGKFGDVVP